MNITRKTQETIRKAYHTCCHLHDQYSSSTRGEYVLGDIMKLAKQARPTMLARLMVVEHYLEGFDAGFDPGCHDEEGMDIETLSGIAHGFQRAFLQGVADGHRAHDAFPNLGEGDELSFRRTQRAMADAWQEHREREMARHAEAVAAASH